MSRYKRKAEQEAEGGPMYQVPCGRFKSKYLYMIKKHVQRCKICREAAKKDGGFDLQKR